MFLCFHWRERETMFYWKKMFKQRRFLVFQFSVLLMLGDSLIGKFLALVKVKKQTFAAPDKNSLHKDLFFHLQPVWYEYRGVRVKAWKRDTWLIRHASNILILTWLWRAAAVLLPWRWQSVWGELLKRRWSTLDRERSTLTRHQTSDHGN